MSDHQEDRSRVVALLATIFPAVQRKTAIEGWRDDWHNCVYLLTQCGQVSWHYHDSHAHLFEHVKEAPGDFEWDGHDTEEKWARVEDLVRAYTAWDFHPQGLFALVTFCARLERDGYIRRNRVAEFRERVGNVRRGRGFATNVELEPHETTQEEDLEDLLS